MMEDKKSVEKAVDIVFCEIKKKIIGILLDEPEKWKEMIDIVIQRIKANPKDVIKLGTEAYATIGAQTIAILTMAEYQEMN